MIRPALSCLLLLASAAAAQENPVLEAAMVRSLAAARAASAAPRPQTLALNACWSRLPQDQARDGVIYDSAKVPQDFCLRSVVATLDGDGGALTADGAYTPASASARVAVDAAPKGLSSYKSSDGTRVYAAYLFEDKNAHGDTGAVFLEFRADKDGKVVPGTAWVTFSVGCPHEECEEGEEPGLRTVTASWP